MSDLRSVLLLCWRDTGHPQGGGSEAYLQRIGAQLAASGVAVTLRTARYPGAPRREVAVRAIKDVVPDLCRAFHRVRPAGCDFNRVERHRAARGVAKFHDAQNYLESEALRVPLPGRLVVEIVSPGSHRMDNVIKHGEYGDAGIPHYWILDLDPPRSLHVWHLADEFGYQDSGTFTGQFTLLDPIKVDIDLGRMV